MTTSLELLLRAGHPLVSIQTTDESRAMQVIETTARLTNRQVFEWSLSRGLWALASVSDPTHSMVGPAKPVEALERVRQTAHGGVYVFKDLAPHCKDASVYRQLRDLQGLLRTTHSTLILLDSTSLPPEVRRMVVRYDLPWPSSDELEDVVKETFQRIKTESLYEVKSQLTRKEMDQLVQSLRGLTVTEAEQVIATAVYRNYSLTGADIPHVVEAKRQLLGAMGCLESVAADFSPDDLGGLDNLKRWLRTRRGGFSPDARTYGLEPPRGVLMIGVQGCGKSLCAKVVAAEWRMPLLRLDPGVLYQKFVGETETRLREALAQAEAMSPVVLWIDEIEKAFASASAQSADGGLSQRMFGTLLSWMQDHRHPIFVIATANQLESLPPELLRKGRFDEIFFVDLPGFEARVQILSIHLSRRGRDPAKFELEEISHAVDGFSGAEIEQLVITAMYTGFAAGREFTSHDLLEASRLTRPLSVVMADRVDALRAWARERCVPAD